MQQVLFVVLPRDNCATTTKLFRMDKPLFSYVCVRIKQMRYDTPISALKVLVGIFIHFVETPELFHHSSRFYAKLG